MNKDKDDIRSLRSSYEQGSLNVDEVSDNPFVQFNRWFNFAIDQEIYEANAMTLATCGSDGQPSARTVLLKEIEVDGFLFYSNYLSKKGLQLKENNKASLLFFWKELERQIRIEGIVEKITPAHSEDYFHSRPRGSQIGAWVSPQSQQITRSELDNRKTEFENKFADQKSIPLPDYWGGYKLKPHYFEFWQGRKNRLHDRISYSPIDPDKWQIKRIAP